MSPLSLARWIAARVESGADVMRLSVKTESNQWNHLAEWTVPDGPVEPFIDRCRRSAGTLFAYSPDRAEPVAKLNLARR